MFHFATLAYMQLTDELPQRTTLLHSKVNHVPSDQILVPLYFVQQEHVIVSSDYTSGE